MTGTSTVDTIAEIRICEYGGSILVGCHLISSTKAASDLLSCFAMLNRTSLELDFSTKLKI